MIKSSLVKKLLKNNPHLSQKDIEIIVDTPTDLTPEQEDILREYAEKRNEGVSSNQKRTWGRR